MLHNLQPSTSYERKYLWQSARALTETPRAWNEISFLAQMHCVIMVFLQKARGFSVTPMMFVDDGWVLYLVQHRRGRKQIIEFQYYNPIRSSLIFNIHGSGRKIINSSGNLAQKGVFVTGKLIQQRGLAPIGRSSQFSGFRNKVQFSSPLCCSRLKPGLLKLYPL